MIKKVLSQKTKDKLGAFCEVYDLIFDEEKSPAKAGNSRKLNNDFKLYGFLQNEVDRLNAIDSFISTKLPTLLKHSQINKLISEQQNNIYHIKSELEVSLTPIHSPLQKQLMQIFNAAFF